MPLFLMNNYQRNDQDFNQVETTRLLLFFFTIIIILVFILITIRPDVYFQFIIKNFTRTIFVCGHLKWIQNDDAIAGTRSQSDDNGPKRIKEMKTTIIQVNKSELHLIEYLWRNASSGKNIQGQKQSLSFCVLALIIRAWFCILGQRSTRVYTWCVCFYYQFENKKKKRSKEK